MMSSDLRRARLWSLDHSGRSPSLTLHHVRRLRSTYTFDGKGFMSSFALHEY
jgi:hypothetical protein